MSMTFHERLGHLHAAVATHLNQLARSSRGQGTVEYVGLILLIAVLIAGVVQASHGFKDTGIAEAVVKKIKGAIDGVSAGR
jgi:Flp pilus assembly pilin Flp